MTIGERAAAYAENLASVPTDDIAYAIGRAYIDGATEALASQWRSVEEEEPPIGKLILCRDAYSVALCIYDGEDMCEAQNDGVLNMPYWMLIPSLPDTNTK